MCAYTDERVIELSHAIAPIHPSFPCPLQRAAQESTLASAAVKGEDKAQRRLEYLMAQSEMFAHFLGAQVSLSWMSTLAC